MRRPALTRWTVLLVWLVASATLADEPPGRERDIETCAKVKASVRAEAFGYTHVVELQNTCARPVKCQVWTDVDPEPKATLRAMPGESDSVVTRRGSPSSSVTAGSRCEYDGPAQKGR